MLAFSGAASAQAPIEYFKGSWTITLKENDKLKLEWEVRIGREGRGLIGEVRTNDVKTSTDYWNSYRERISRIAMTTGGLVVEMESRGWKGDVLILTGNASEGDSQFKVRETITKRSQDEFHALWERQAPNGRWTVFSEEICKRKPKK